MKTKQIRAAVSRTVNMGNFESLRIEADVTIDLDPKDDPQDAFVQAFEDVKNQVRQRTTSEEVKQWRRPY